MHDVYVLYLCVCWDCRFELILGSSDFTRVVVGQEIYIVGNSQHLYGDLKVYFESTITLSCIEGAA